MLTHDRASRILRAAGAKVQCTVNGQRNEALNAAAYTAGRLHGAGVLGEREAVFYLYGVGIGLTDAECRATIKSGFNTGVKNPMKDRRNG